LNRRRRLDVDDHEVPCGVHFFSIAACTDKNAESVGAQRYTVSTTNIGQRWAARQTVCSISFRISGPVDCYQIVTGELSYFPLPSFVTLACRAAGILVCTPPLRGGCVNHLGGRHGGAVDSPATPNPGPPAAKGILAEVARA
jgi:hypothetical protein